MSSPVQKCSSYDQPHFFYSFPFCDEIEERDQEDQKANEVAVEIFSSTISDEDSSKTSNFFKQSEIGVHDKWCIFLKDELGKWTPETLHEHIRDRRKEIFAQKEDYRSKQALAEMATEEGVIYQNYRGIPEMRRTICELMREEKIKQMEGGKSGVYQLCDKNGIPKFIIKPTSEEFLGLDNPKNNASPYADNEVGRPKVGIPLYDSAKNSELSYLFAKCIGIENVTPKTDVMILESPLFSDITDGVREREDLLFAAGLPDREKLCVVQEFIPNYSEFGQILLSNSGLTKEEYEGLGELQKTEVHAKVIPSDIDLEMFENCCLLSWLIGEKDGNAGNFLIADHLDDSFKRRMIKIDNAASCPEDNKELRSGISWFEDTYAKNPLSTRMAQIINDADFESLSQLMKSRGKSEQAICALKQRVEYLKTYISLGLTSDWEIEDLDLHMSQHFET